MLRTKRKSMCFGTSKSFWGNFREDKKNRGKNMAEESDITWNRSKAFDLLNFRPYSILEKKNTKKQLWGNSLLPYPKQPMQIKPKKLRASQGIHTALQKLLLQGLVAFFPSFTKGTTIWEKFFASVTMLSICISLHLPKAFACWQPILNLGSLSPMIHSEVS